MSHHQEGSNWRNVRSKQFIKNPLSGPVRVGRGLMNGEIKGSGWLEVNKYRKQRLKKLTISHPRVFFKIPG